MKTSIVYNPTEKDIERAAEIIRNGGIVAFPTETVYGLGADATNPSGAEKIFKAKGRPSDNPLIVHLADASDAGKYGYVSDLFQKLAERFMPGPLTVIVPKKEIIPDSVTAGLDTVGLRVPSNKIAHSFIEACGTPIAAPSANLSGLPSTTTAEHVITDLAGKVDMILCGEPSEIGVESTVIKITDNSVVILRPGYITKEMLSEVCGNVTVSPAVTEEFKGIPESPGMKYKHYSPNADVYVVEGTEDEISKYLSDKKNCGLILFDDDRIRVNEDITVKYIGSYDDKLSQAHNLFKILREFDDAGVSTVYARCPSKDGIGLAVYNRLIRAAAFKIINLNKNKDYD